MGFGAASSAPLDRTVKPRWTAGALEVGTGVSLMLTPVEGGAEEEGAFVSTAFFLRANCSFLLFLEKKTMAAGLKLPLPKEVDIVGRICSLKGK